MSAFADDFDFDKEWETFSRELEAGDDGDGPKEVVPELSAENSHTIHKREPNTWRVSLQVFNLYTIDIAGDTEEEAAKKAIDEFGMLQPDETRVRVESVQIVTPMTVARMEAGWELVKSEEQNPIKRKLRGVELMNDVKVMMTDESLSVSDKDRLQFLQSSIVKTLLEDEDEPEDVKADGNADES